MGFAACWLAVRGKAPQTVLAELELEPRGERDDYPVESPIASAELPGGWHLVVFDGKPELGEELLGRLSRGCEAVAAGVEEHVMRSYAEGWQDGERRWHVVHDSSAGIYDLTSSGALPEPFE